MRPTIKITAAPISVDEVLRAVSSEAAGGAVCFVGTVRSSSDGFAVDSVEVESSEELAAADLERICASAAERYPLVGVSVAHRTGTVKVGEVIVAIAVSAVHRSEAFDGCRFIIDELKKTTPIWKKEIGPVDSRWSEAER